ncbi:MAG: hypothetical protein AB9879_09440 [Methanothrix sp.]
MTIQVAGFYLLLAAPRMPAACSSALVLSRVLIVCPFMGRFMLGSQDLGVYVNR